MLSLSTIVFIEVLIVRLVALENYSKSTTDLLCPHLNRSDGQLLETNLPQCLDPNVVTKGIVSEKCTRKNVRTRTKATNKIQCTTIL